jgi:hypothetical protein
MAIQAYYTCDIRGEETVNFAYKEFSAHYLIKSIDFVKIDADQAYTIRDICVECHKKIEKLLRENHMLEKGERCYSYGEPEAEDIKENFCMPPYVIMGDSSETVSHEPKRKIEPEFPLPEYYKEIMKQIITTEEKLK